MADLFEDYRLGPGWDEMFAEPGLPRESYESLHATLHSLPAPTCSAPVPGSTRR